MALQVGILVALTQQIPEHQVLLFGAIGIRVKVSIYPFFSLLTHPYELKMAIITALAYALCDVLQYHVHYWLSIALHPHSIWLARVLGVPPILQANRR